MSPEQLTLKNIFYAPVAQKQFLAEELHQKYTAAFLQNKDLCADLELLNECSLLLNDFMVEVEMGKLCVRCASGKGGGCCSLYMADETDVVQMLMNMLSGVTVKQVQNNTGECCYLGEHGCLFIFKPMFCLNYNCRNILNSLSSQELRQLEQLAGKLLCKQYEVEKRLLGLMRDLTSISL